MRKIAVLLLVVFLALSMCSCSSSGDLEKIYTVEKSGKSFTVNTENGTISDGINIYHYTFSGDTSGCRINITYPNGASYWYHNDNGGGYGGWSDQYDGNRYVPGDILCDIVRENIPKPASSDNFLLIVLLFILGAFNVVFPHKSWYIEYGWRYKNAEPSEIALWMNRAVGVLLLFIAAVLIIV